MNEFMKYTAPDNDTGLALVRLHRDTPNPFDCDVSSAIKDGLSVRFFAIGNQATDYFDSLESTIQASTTLTPDSRSLVSTDSIEEYIVPAANVTARKDENKKRRDISQWSAIDGAQYQGDGVWQGQTNSSAIRYTIEAPAAGNQPTMTFKAELNPAGSITARIRSTQGNKLLHEVVYQSASTIEDRFHVLLDGNENGKIRFDILIRDQAVKFSNMMVGLR